MHKGCGIHPSHSIFVIPDSIRLGGRGGVRCSMGPMRTPHRSTAIRGDHDVRSASRSSFGSSLVNLRSFCLIGTPPKSRVLQKAQQYVCIGDQLMAKLCGRPSFVCLQTMRLRWPTVMWRLGKARIASRTSSASGSVRIFRFGFISTVFTSLSGMGVAKNALHHQIAG